MLDPPDPKSLGPCPKFSDPMDMDLSLGPIKKLGSISIFSWTRSKSDACPSLIITRVTGS